MDATLVNPFIEGALHSTIIQGTASLYTTISYLLVPADVVIDFSTEMAPLG